MKTLIIACLILLLVTFIYFKASSRRRYRKGGILVMRRGQGANPRMQNGNICLCPHKAGGKPCGKKAEMGKLAEPGLCKHCRMHGPRGQDRRDWDDI